MSFLDTSFIIDLLREEKRRTRGPAHQKLEQLGETPVRLSLFVVCELEAGVSLSASKKEREQIQLFCQHCEVVYPDDRLAPIYGNVLAHLQRQGTPIGVMDLLIGSQALAWDEPLISRNLKDFQKIPNLQLESY